MDANQIDHGWFVEITTTQADHVKLEIATVLERAIKHSSITRSELARRISTSPAWITKVLRGDANLTVDTICELADALNHDIHIHMAPKSAAVRWFEAYESKVHSESEQEHTHSISWNKVMEKSDASKHPIAA